MDYLIQQMRCTNSPIKIDLKNEEILIGTSTVPSLSRYRNISETHASLSKINYTWYIEDLGSEHGVFVNSSRIGKMPKAINYWDTIGFGSESDSNDGFVCVLCPASRLYSSSDNKQACNSSAEYLEKSLTNQEVNSPMLHDKKLNLTTCKLSGNKNNDECVVIETETEPDNFVHSHINSSFQRKRKNDACGSNLVSCDTTWKLKKYFSDMNIPCDLETTSLNISKTEGAHSTKVSANDMCDSDAQSESSSVKSLNIIKYPSKSVILELDRMKEEKLKALKKEHKISCTTAETIKTNTASGYKDHRAFSKSSQIKLKKHKMLKVKSAKEIRTVKASAVIHKSGVTSKPVTDSIRKKYKSNIGSNKLSKKNMIACKVNLQHPSKKRFVSKNQNKSEFYEIKKKKEKASLVMKKPEDSGYHAKTIKIAPKISQKDKIDLKHQKTRSKDLKIVPFEPTRVTDLDSEADQCSLTAIDLKNSSERRDSNIKVMNPSLQISQSQRDRTSQSQRDRTSQSERDKRSQSERDKRSQSERDKRSQSERDKRSQSERDKRSQSERDKRSQSERDKRSQSERDKTSQSERDKTSQSERDKTSQSQQGTEITKSSSNSNTKPYTQMTENVKSQVNNSSKGGSIETDRENLYFKLIKKIVKFNTQWIQEREYSNTQYQEPPEVSEGADVLPLSFNSYNSYVNAFFPMIILETWQEICIMSKCTENVESAKFYFIILAACNENGILKLQCESIVNNNITFDPQRYNLVILNLKSSSSEYSAFGFITKHEHFEVHESVLPLEWKTLPSDWTKNVHLTRFDMYINSREEMPLYRNLMEGRSICSLEQKIKLVDALDNLKFSPLLYDILLPNWNTFSVSCSGEMYEVIYKYVRYKVKYPICNTMLEPGNKIILLQGPPGSGKSGILSEVIDEFQFYKCIEQKMLFTAPSYSGVNAIGNRIIDWHEEVPLRELEPKLIILGSPQNFDERVQKYTLFNKLKCRINAERRYVERQCYNIQCSLNELERSNEERRDDKINELKLEQESLQQEFLQTWQSQNRGLKLLQEANVIVSTLNECVFLNKYKNILEFKFCIIDQAEEANELEFLLPLTLGINKFIISGDKNQLPPIVKSELSLNCGFQRSIMERFHDFFMSKFKKSPAISLTEQFRMHTSIWHFPLHYIYNDLIPSENSIPLRAFEPVNPYIVLDDKSKCEEYDSTGLSQIKKICYFFRKNFRCFPLGLIVPSEEMKAHFQAVLLRPSTRLTLTIDTVNGFQGIDRKIVIISCFQNEIQGKHTYFSCKRHLNVALTRATTSLILCGPFNNLNCCQEMKDLISDAVTRRCYFSYTSRKDIPFLLKQFLLRPK